jgi:mono/diheme cytochrome c family protein
LARRAGAGLGVALLLLAPASLAAQPASRPKRPPAPAPAHGGPLGRGIAWPAGDAARGREVFVKFECHSCHEVRGERFPAPDPETPGPELSAMGPLHDRDYFVESLVNPSATIERGHGYEGPDGSSKMPSYNDVMTVQELVDLVAFLLALRPPAGTAPAHRH